MRQIILNIHPKLRKVEELKLKEDDPRIFKLVGYYSENSHSSSLRGINKIHIHTYQY